MEYTLIRKTIVVFTVSLLLIACGAPEQRTGRLTSHIPETASVIVKIPNPQAFFNSLKNNDFLKDNTLLPPGLSRKLETLKILESNSEALLCIRQEADSIYDYVYLSRDVLPDSIPGWEVKTSSRNGVSFRELTSKDKHFFSAVTDSVSIISSSGKLMEESLLPRDNAPESFQKIFALSEGNTQAALFLKNDGFNPGNPLLAVTDTVPQPVAWTMYDLALSPGELLLSGIVPETDSLAPGEVPPLLRRSPEITPSAFRGMVSLTPRNFSGNRDSLSPEIKELLAITDEIGLIFTENYDAAAFHTFDTEMAENAFSSSAVLHSTFRDHDIYQISPIAPFEETLPPFGRGKTAAFYTTLNDFLILSEHPEALTDLISHYQNKSTLSARNFFQQISASLPDASSTLAVASDTRFKELLFGRVVSRNTPEMSFTETEAFPYLVIQGLDDHRFTHTNILLRKPGSSITTQGISEKFNIALDADIALPPRWVTNHLNKQNEIVVQDVEHNLYLISGEGKVLWKKKLGGPVLGGISQVDLFGNGKLQLAFALSDGIYIVDRNGNDVAPFPVKVDHPITRGLAVFDYDRNKKYRFFITQNNTLVPFDSGGKRVNGFVFGGTGSAIINPPRHIRVGRRDYIVIQEENGTLHLLHRTGRTRVKVNGKIDFSGNEVFLYEDKFTTTNTSGDLIQVDEQGRLNKISLGLAGEHGIYATSRTLATMSDNLFTVKQNKHELDYGIYTTPEIFYINNKIYVGLTDMQVKKVYIFDSNAQLLGNSPVYGASAIDLREGSNGGLEFVTQGEKDKIIVYQM
ncbi:hypothetical protein [Sinomicrobium soli]|uniref:hypothetical protein n=1 Tax=Sinomicrobium sp. N-1-3-6 TaxID=2219864 RepID=UPI000DCD1DAA|nr:hypothetical protein [Sinomicrobium sp. N-1-3-6]RAV30427.1 hypothetical protein DN748_02665 [Sinomicrobium sp. N-1-3-6]